MECIAYIIRMRPRFHGRTSGFDRSLASRSMLEALPCHSCGSPSFGCDGQTNEVCARQTSMPRFIGRRLTDRQCFYALHPVRCDRGLPVHTFVLGARGMEIRPEALAFPECDDRFRRFLFLPGTGTGGPGRTQARTLVSSSPGPAGISHWRVRRGKWDGSPLWHCDP